LREQSQTKRRKELEERFETGGAVEAALRSLAYIRAGEGSVDERGFAMLKQLHDAQPPGRPRTMKELKAVLRDQYLLLRLDEERAVAAIPKLLPRDGEERARTLRAVQRVASATGDSSEEGKRRLVRIEKLFAVKTAETTKKEDSNAGA